MYGFFFGVDRAYLVPFIRKLRAVSGLPLAPAKQMSVDDVPQDLPVTNFCDVLWEFPNVRVWHVSRTGETVSKEILDYEDLKKMNMKEIEGRVQSFTEDPLVGKIRRYEKATNFKMGDMEGLATWRSAEKELKEALQDLCGAVVCGGLVYRLVEDEIQTLEVAKNFDNIWTATAG
jgi:hypothetical protein